MLHAHFEEPGENSFGVGLAKGNGMLNIARARARALSL